MQPTDIRDPDYFHKVVDCQWACPAHTPVPEYIRLIADGRYADFDYAVAHYNDTLVNALSDVATQLSGIRSVDNELAASVRAQDAARRALRLALAQYKSGLTTQLTVLHAQANALTADEQVASLRMARRDHQIALASALGGGYQEAPQNTQAR